MLKKLSLVAIIGLFGLFVANQCLAYVSPGKFNTFVSDFANIMSVSTRETLEQKLVDFERAETNEIAVVTVPTLGDETIETYAVALFKEWGIGKRQYDNGVLLLVAPNEREVRIEVGYGLEGALTDLESSQIINNVLIPAFKKNDFDTGITQAVNAIMAAIKGEYTPPPYEKSFIERHEKFFSLIFISIGVLSVLFVFISVIVAVLAVWSGSKRTWPGIVAGIIMGCFLVFAIYNLQTSLLALILGGAIGGLAGWGLDGLVSKHPKINEWMKNKGGSGKGGLWLWRSTDGDSSGDGDGDGGGGGGDGGGGGGGGGDSGGGGASGSW